MFCLKVYNHLRISRYMVTVILPVVKCPFLWKMLGLHCRTRWHSFIIFSRVFIGHDSIQCTNVFTSRRKIVLSYGIKNVNSFRWNTLYHKVKPVMLFMDVGPRIEGSSLCQCLMMNDGDLSLLGLEPRSAKSITTAVSLRMKNPLIINMIQYSGLA